MKARAGLRVGCREMLLQMNPEIFVSLSHAGDSLQLKISKLHFMLKAISLPQ